MTNWGPSDPNFDKTMIKIFGSNSPEMRRKIYYTICIPIRLTLYLSIIYLCRFSAVIGIIGILAGITMIQLWPSLNNPGEQWWSKRLLYFYAGIIFILAWTILYFRYTSRDDSKLRYGIPGILLLSLVTGLLQSFRELRQ